MSSKVKDRPSQGSGAQHCNEVLQCAVLFDTLFLGALQQRVGSTSARSFRESCVLAQDSLLRRDCRASRRIDCLSP